MNDNRTFAIYLVDLFCLGIKNIDYYFNVPEYEFEEYLDGLVSNDSVSCEYNLVHNIIYGALEFAADYGFSPHKDWKVAQYILEEDDEKIPIIEINFGDENGKPLYTVGPYDSVTRQKQILETLKRTAGPGNYHFILNGGEETADFEEDEEEDEDDFEETFYDELEEDSAFDPGEIEEILSGEKMPGLRQMLILMAAHYRLVFPEDDLIDVESLNEAMEIVPDPYTEDYIGEDKYTIKLLDLLLKIEKDEQADIDKNLVKLNKFRKKYGDNPLLLTTIFSCQAMLSLPESQDIVEKMQESYPDYLYFRFLRAYTLIDAGNLPEAWRSLGQAMSLGEAFPERKRRFTQEETVVYHAAMCAWFVGSGELGKAINYGNLAAKLNEKEPMVVDAVRFLCEAIQNALSSEMDEEKEEGTKR